MLRELLELRQLLQAEILLHRLIDDPALRDLEVEAAAQLADVEQRILSRIVELSEPPGREDRFTWRAEDVQWCSEGGV